MPEFRRFPHRPSALLVLPPLAAAAVLSAGLLGVPGIAAGNGVVGARAELLAAPAAAQMMMPMDAGMQHADEIQVVLDLRNDSAHELTVPFDRIAMIGTDGTRVPATGGLVGDLRLRPHAAAEERLRFPAATGDHLRLAVPDGAHDRVLDLPVSGTAGTAGTVGATSPTHRH